ncbi:MAG: hypothetical protein FVQ82_11805 [Planctomycetes bacterium]|nr:hypothetical protein [Planctomycetota bacterium]
MDYETENNQIQLLISEAIEMSHEQFDPGQLPHFDEIARTCREQNRIADEITVLELAVDFYKNPELQYDERISKLNKFKARLNARQKEAKVLEVLGW